MLAGLVLQVVTLLVFIVLAADFGLRTRRAARRLGGGAGAGAALDPDPALARVRADWRFRGFLAALGLAVVTVFWRSVYRSAELSQGWTGPLMYDQDMFVGFEGVMIVVAVSALLVFHPAVCLGEVIETGGVRAAASSSESALSRAEEEGGDVEMASTATKFAASSGGSSGETTESGEQPAAIPKP